MSDVKSVAGGWLGTFYYANRTLLPVRFEATFARLSEKGDGAERFNGSIMDDDGGHGDAQVSQGVQQGTFVRFVKTYTPPMPGLFPVHYVGTLSAEGRLLTGHWKITLVQNRHARAREITGTWEARRRWTADADDAADESGAGIGRERELVGAR